MSDSFSGELWQGVAGVYDAILAHPFLTGLTDGSLPHDAFAFYVVQDAIYLHSYARALAGVASRAPAPSVARPCATASPATAAACRAASASGSPAASPAARAAECVHPAPWVAATW